MRTDFGGCVIHDASSLLKAWKDHYGVLRYVAGEVNTQVAGMMLEGAMNFIPIFTIGHYPTLTKGGCRVQFVGRDQKPLAGIVDFHLLCDEQRFLGHDDCLLAKEYWKSVASAESSDKRNTSPLGVTGDLFASVE
jgi:hypothetical protein